MHAIVVAVVVLSVFHCVLGLMSVCLGVSASIEAEVWLAHSISPIWSGGFFAITGILGFVCAKRRTAYMIMCFTALSIVSLVTAVVSIQLLRMGLVNQTTDGSVYQKEPVDKLIVVAMGCAGVEGFICLISSLVSCRMARAAKKDMERKRDGTFHVQDGEDTVDNNNRCAVYTVEKGYHNPNMLGLRGQEETRIDEILISLSKERGQEEAAQGNKNELAPAMPFPQYQDKENLNNNSGANDATNDTADEDREKLDNVQSKDKKVQGQVKKVRVEIEDHTDDEESIRSPNALFLASKEARGSTKGKLKIVNNLAAANQNTESKPS